jgi:carboxymethylenebutenolidase
MTTLSAEQKAMVALFQQHVGAELAGDLETTMNTMTGDPHLNHVATMAGGVGFEGVRAFYRDHLIGRFFPPDVKMTTVSSTVGHDQVVEELFISFTHTTPMDWILPGVPPTGKHVEMAIGLQRRLPSLPPPAAATPTLEPPGLSACPGLAVVSGWAL